MEFINEVKEHGPLLNDLLHRALVNSVHSTAFRCQRSSQKPAQEPDYIAGLVLDFAPDLFSILTLLFKKHRFSVSSVYCHQKPLADYGGTKSPEIGDILFVFIHTDRVGDKTCNSLLFQAKVTRQKQLTISASDDHQLMLYARWPAFEYKRAGTLTKQIRNIQPKSITQGAQYLLIDDTPLQSPHSPLRWSGETGESWVVTSQTHGKSPSLETAAL